MADMGFTEVSATTEEIVSSLIQDELIAKSILIPTVTDFSNMAEKGVNVIKVPRAGSFTADSKSENTPLVAQIITYATDDLALDQHKAIQVRLEDFANIKAKPDVVADIISRMGSKLALDIDEFLYERLKEASAAAPDHRIAYAGSSIAQEDILEARKLLNDQNVPMDNRFLLINPASEKSMLLIDDFVRADSYGDARGLRNGELGRIYGMTVLMSTVVGTLESIVYHTSAVGYARQISADFETDRDSPNLATLYSLSNLYGAVTFDSGKRQVLVGTAT